VSAPTATQVQAGDQLPELALEITPTVIIAAALASRDFERVHHDRTYAEGNGMRDIFLNILATNGFVVRYVTDWAGAQAVVKQSSIRLGVPHYAGETLTLTGSVEEVAADGDVRIAVRGRNALGDHVTGTVTVQLDGASS
jgi:acyl dehydratase